MYATLIDGYERPIGSVIVEHALRVMGVYQEKGEKENWYTHSVWRFEPGEEVSWIYKSVGRVQLRTGRLVKLKGDYVIVERHGHEFKMALNRILPKE